jgi:peptidyl-prolyl cis-trans isomerase SurA
MKKILNIVLFTIYVLSINAQEIDKVEAIIGDEILITSEIESQYLQYLTQGNSKSDIIKCDIVEELLFQKLLLNQAKIDSIVVTDEEIDSEIDKRIRYFESQLGSISKVEEYFGKSKSNIQLELGKVIADQFMAQKVQSTIISDVKMTPAEVSLFFNNKDKSDIPQVNSKVEISQIIIKPSISSEQKNKLKNKLNSFRERVYKGEDFKMLATLYSDDPGSAVKGGELGFVNRGDLVPEFERAAFRLKEGEISAVVESQFGFHIVQLIERRGEQINVRHILLKTKVSSTSLYNTKIRIKEIKQDIESKKITFEEAITKYSNDDSKKNGGLLLNPNTMSTMHTIEDLSPLLKKTVKILGENEISSPIIMNDKDDSQAYRIIKINKKIEAHKANLVDDFAMIKEIAMSIKKQEEIVLWTEKTINKTYIKINSDILNCKFKNKWKN